MQRFTTAAAMVLALGTFGPAWAVPIGIATAEVSIWFAPAAGGSRTGRSFVLVPVTAGVVGPGGNEAWARVAYTPAPGAGALPTLGAPGAVSLELGAQATLQAAWPLTSTGNIADPALQPMWRDVVAATASYQDQVTFIDASLPAGAPLSVHLGWYLGSALCRSAVPVSAASCQVMPPQAWQDIAAQGVHAYAHTLLASTVALPGGTDTAQSLREEPRGPRVAGPRTLSGNTLEHHFTVPNGATLDWRLSLQALVQFDGREWLDPLNPDRALFGTVKAWEDLDYLGTLHIGTLYATDEQGNLRPGFEMRTSFGWALAPQPAAAVPEPASALLLLAGLAGTLRRRLRHGAGLLLLAGPLAADAQAPSLRVQGQADSSMAMGSGIPAEFNHVRQGGGVLVDSVLSLGNLTDPAVDIRFWSRSSAQALASAQPGHLGVQAGGEVVLGALGSGGQYARALARASFADWITFTPSDPALLFTGGNLRYRVDWSGNGGVMDLSTTATVEAKWCGSAGAAPLQCGGWLSDAGHTGVGSLWGVLPGTVEYEQRFVWGVPTPIGLTLISEFTIWNLDNGSASGFFDLSHSAAWGGILAVRDAAGKLVAPQAYLLTSASGTDYSGPIAAVPAPPALRLWLAAAPLLWRRRSASSRPLKPQPSALSHQQVPLRLSRRDQLIGSNALDLEVRVLESKSW